MPNPSDDVAVPDAGDGSKRRADRAPRTLPEWRDSLARCVKRMIARGADIDTTAFERWTRLVDLIEYRRALADDAPLLTVLLGPTGAGKSTVFNQILGKTISKPGAIRPCTNRPVAFGSTRDIAFFERDPLLAANDLDIDWVADYASITGDSVLIDTPDFDSVEVENRRRAELLLYRADRVVIVMTPEKYGDASVWNLIDEIRELGNIVACIFNKHEERNAGSLDDLSRLLGERGLPMPIAAPRSANPDAVDELSAELRHAYDGLLLTERDTKGLLRDRLGRLVAAEERARQQAISDWIDSNDRALAAIRQGVARLHDELRTVIRRELALEIDSALRRELESKFLDEVQRVDLLREPRRWITAPFQWLTKWVSSGDGDKKAERLSTADWLVDLYRERYREFSFGLLAKLRELLKPALSIPDRAARETIADGDALAIAGSKLSRASTLDALPTIETPTDAELDQRLHGVFDRLEQEITCESERIAEGLPLSGKVSFYGSQIIFHTLVATALVKTGGLFTGAEMAAQGLVSPFVAKLVGQFVSSSEADAVEARLASAFEGLMIESVEPYFSRIAESLEQIRDDFPDRGEWQRAVESWNVSLAKFRVR